MVITVKIEVSEEDLRAGNWTFSPDRPKELMDAEDMVMFHLKPALLSKIHALRSKMKWAELKIYNDPNILTEEGHTCTTVKDSEGREHSVMLPNGQMWSMGMRVTSPWEGSWDCENSPTKTCWYDRQMDPALDGCLFCGDPHERK